MQVLSHSPINYQYPKKKEQKALPFGMRFSLRNALPEMQNKQNKDEATSYEKKSEQVVNLYLAKEILKLNPESDMLGLMESLGELRKVFNKKNSFNPDFGQIKEYEIIQTKILPSYVTKRIEDLLEKENINLGDQGLYDDFYNFNYKCPDGKNIKLTGIFKHGENSKLYWKHPKPEDAKAAIREAHRVIIETKDESKNLDFDSKLKKIAEVHWLLAHANLYLRGSAAVADWVVDAFASSLNIQLMPWKEGVAPDRYALSANLEDFKEEYRDLFCYKPISLSNKNMMNINEQLIAY
ncbi:MAG: hypothetical protein HRT47_05955 [Candidatus Caenarcaniphilales bacterium]|nr:hypothetical protein [Candidatus Caenarcaniphilales bacterium]